MAVVMDMKWAGVTPEQYDRTREVVGWETEHPDGAMFHVAWFGDGALNVTDLWESEDAWNRFLSERLQPGIREVGIEGQPEVQLREAHAVFAPAYE